MCLAAVSVSHRHRSHFTQTKDPLTVDSSLSRQHSEVSAKPETLLATKVIEFACPDALGSEFRADDDESPEPSPGLLKDNDGYVFNCQLPSQVSFNF